MRAETRDRQRVFRLARIPDGTTRSLEVLLLLGASQAVGVVLRDRTAPGGWLKALAALLVVGIAVELVRWLRMRFTQAILCLEKDGLHVCSRTGSSLLRIGYGDILSLERYAWPKKTLMLCSVGRMPLDLRETLFDSASDVVQLVDELRERIRSLDDGLVERVAAREQAGAFVFRAVPWLSLGFAGVLVGVFVLLAAGSSGTGADRAVALGASNGELLFRGELRRLFCPSFLHTDLMHLATNAGTIVVMGAALEGFLGRARLITLFGLSSVVGFLASAVWDPANVTVGASPGVFGLVGALLSANARRRDELPSRLRLPWRALVAFIGMVLAGGFLSAGKVDHLSHAGGLLMGAGLYQLMVWKTRLVVLPSEVPRATLHLSWVVSALYVLALGSVVLEAIRLRGMG